MIPDDTPPEEPEPSQWTVQQERTALALAGGSTVRGAAEKNGTTKRTVYRWLADGQFKNYVAELRSRMLDRALGQLARDTFKAARTLRKLMDDPSPQVRHRAAAAILENAVRIRDHVELDQRLQAIEAANMAREQDQKSGGKAWG